MEVCFWIAGASFGWAIGAAGYVLWHDWNNTPSKRIQRRLDELKAGGK